jgi:hypothetical protein
VPAKIRPSDWDELFAPNAPRRGGPLRAFVNVLITLVFLLLIGGGVLFGLIYRNTQIAAINATNTAVAPTIIAIATQTAEARAQATATQIAASTATAIAALPTPEPILGVGTVINGGNLRQEAPNDTITFLQEQHVGGGTWFRIRVTQPAANRGGEGVAADTEGWASGTLLSEPSPAP